MWNTVLALIHLSLILLGMLFPFLIDKTLMQSGCVASDKMKFYVVLTKTYPTVQSATN